MHRLLRRRASEIHPEPIRLGFRTALCKNRTSAYPALRRRCTLLFVMSYRFSAMLHIPGDVRDAVTFYERAFGATTGWSTPPAADMVAQLLVHDAEFWVHPAGEEIGNPSPTQLGGTAVRLMLIVSDPDAVFSRAVAAGAVIRSAMQDRDYGWRDGSIVDPSGHRWEIGKPL